MSDADYEDVIKRLVEIKKQIDEIIGVFEKQSPKMILVTKHSSYPLPPDEYNEWIIEKYRLLKEKLESEYERFKTDNGYDQASEAEQYFYVHAITDAGKELKYKTGDQPCDEMLVCLDGAEAEISHHLSFMPPGKSNVIKLDTK